MLGGVTVHVDAAMEVTERFSALKAILETIPAVYANFQVRLRPIIQYPFLTNVSAGNRRRRE